MSMSYRDLVEHLGPERSRLLATMLEQSTPDPVRAPREPEGVPAYLASYDRARVQDALRYLCSVEPQGFGGAVALLEGLPKAPKRHLHPVFFQKLIPKDGAVQLRRLAAGEAVELDDPERAAYAAAVLRTIQRTFEDRYGTDGRLKHEVGLMHAALGRFDRGEAFARELIPTDGADRIYDAQLTALRFVAVAMPDAPAALRAEVLKKIGEMGTAVDVRVLVELRDRAGGDDRVLAERAIRAIGNRAGWKAVEAALLAGPRPVLGLGLIRELARIKQLNDELRNSTGGPHPPDAFFIGIQSECLDLFLEEGRSQIHKQVELDVARERPDIAADVLSTTKYVEYHRRLRQVFTIRSLDDVRPDILRSPMPEPPLRMAGDPETKYLFTIDDDGVHVAPEKTPMTTMRGHITHTNESAPSLGAFTAGELRFITTNEIILNCASGRYGPRSKEAYDATIHYFEKLGFIVHAMPHLDFS